jgi:AraC-like DNA-binding protein
MQNVLATADMDVEHQFNGFRRAVRSEITHLNVERGKAGSFHAMVKKNRAGSFDFTHVECDPVQIERCSSGIEMDRDDCYFLTVQRSGFGKVRQMGREIDLRPGDFAIVDSTVPYVITFTEPVTRLVARIPRLEFLQRGCTSEHFCGRVFHASEGAGKIASDLLDMLCTSGSDLNAGLGMSLSAAALDAIAIADSQGGADRPKSSSYAQGEVLKRVRAIVLARLPDPDLNIDRIAQEAGVSVRYLHKVFSGTGTTLNRWIQEERLARCYRQLASPHHEHRSIQEIAFGNGFNDSGYFSNRFARMYGAKPSQVRETMRLDAR